MLHRKQFENLAQRDFEELCQIGYPESDQLELKEFVPGRNGPDRWHEGRGQIGEYGRDSLLTELVGMANTRGGDLVVGIRESDDNPKRALAIVPVPQCADLADRFRQQIYACVEPRLTDIQVRGIPVADDGSGILVVRVRRSPNAPHRLTTDRECYIRRGTSTERMTMREIQDLTLTALRGYDFVRERMDRLRADFELVAKPNALNIETKRVGIRASSIPIQRLALAPDAAARLVQASDRQFRIHRDDGSSIAAQVPVHGFNNRPVLRGHMIDHDAPGLRFRQTVFDDGSQSAYFVHALRAEQEGAGVIFAEWVLGLSLCVLKMTDSIATNVQSPTAEFAIEVELTGPNSPALLQFGAQLGTRTPETILTLPTYSFAPEQGPLQVIALINSDLRNSVGKDRGRAFTQIE